MGYLPYGLALPLHIKFEIPTAMLQNSRTKGKRIIINIENMANWATTSYRIEGSKSDLKRVFNVIDGFMTAKRKPTSVTTSKDWEGNVFEALGATEEQLSKNYLRGFIIREGETSIWRTVHMVVNVIDTVQREKLNFSTPKREFFKHVL